MNTALDSVINIWQYTTLFALPHSCTVSYLPLPILLWNNHHFCIAVVKHFFLPFNVSTHITVFFMHRLSHQAKFLHASYAWQIKWFWKRQKISTLLTKSVHKEKVDAWHVGYKQHKKCSYLLSRYGSGFWINMGFNVIKMVTVTVVQL